MQTQSTILNVLKHIDLEPLYTDYVFVVKPVGDSYYLQLVYNEACIYGKNTEAQHGRKWLLSKHMTNSEIVQTAFKAVLTSLEHRAREHFKYKNERIMSPHFDIEERVSFCKTTKFDSRKPSNHQHIEV